MGAKSFYTRHSPIDFDQKVPPYTANPDYSANLYPLPSVEDTVSPSRGGDRSAEVDCGSGDLDGPVISGNPSAADSRQERYSVIDQVVGADEGSGHMGFNTAHSKPPMCHLIYIKLILYHPRYSSICGIVKIRDQSHYTSGLSVIGTRMSICVDSGLFVIL